MRPKLRTAKPYNGKIKAVRSPLRQAPTAPARYRKVTQPLYKSKRWRDARLRHLGREPLCRACAEVGVVTAATVVDHVIPHRGDLTLFWDASNYASLCHPCHGKKQAADLRDHPIPEDAPAPKPPRRYVLA